MTKSEVLYGALFIATFPALGILAVVLDRVLPRQLRSLLASEERELERERRLDQPPS